MNWELHFVATGMLAATLLAGCGGATSGSGTSGNSQTPPGPVTGGTPAPTPTGTESATYTTFAGFIGTDLINNTNGAWNDDQIYIEILGNDPNTGALSWVNYDGKVTAASVSDNVAPGSLAGPDGQTYPNYSFTLAQSNHLLKLPPLNSGRIYVSLGAPMYIPIRAGSPVLGYAGPNPLNASDPNTSTHYDWYEFTWGAPSESIFINTTQVDYFGLPLTVDVWGGGAHQRMGITESIAEIDKEFALETPAAFQAGKGGVPAVSSLRIWAPAHMTFAGGGENAHYFDSYVASVWAEYATNPLNVMIGSRQFSGTTSGNTFNFTEINLNNGAYQGSQTYTVNEPSTEDILLCAGTMATAPSGTGFAVTLALEAQICAALNRHVMNAHENWNNVPAYYQAAPANYYAAFWHAHSIGGASYGFAFDDVNNQSSSIIGTRPEHMAFGIGY